MRAARFAAQLGFEVDESVVAAMTAMAERIEIISAERVRDELVKLVMGAYPRRGLTLLVDTGLAELVLPELPALALERELQAQLFASSDAKEGLSAYIEKRTAEFEGK